MPVRAESGIEPWDRMRRNNIPDRVFRLGVNFIRRMPREIQFELFDLRVKLDAQAIAQVESPDSCRVKMLNYLKSRAHLGEQGLGLGGRMSRIIHAVGIRSKLFERDRQIAVLVQVADQELGCFPQLRIQAQRAQLPKQMIGERSGLGEKLLEGRLVRLFILLGGAETGIQVLL